MDQEKVAQPTEEKKAVEITTTDVVEEAKEQEASAEAEKNEAIFSVIPKEMREAIQLFVEQSVKKRVEEQVSIQKEKMTADVKELKEQIAKLQQAGQPKPTARPGQVPRFGSGNNLRSMAKAPVTGAKDPSTPANKSTPVKAPPVTARPRPGAAAAMRTTNSSKNVLKVNPAADTKKTAPARPVPTRNPTTKREQWKKPEPKKEEKKVAEKKEEKKEEVKEGEEVKKPELTEEEIKKEQKSDEVVDLEVNPTAEVKGEEEVKKEGENTEEVKKEGEEQKE